MGSFRISFARTTFCGVALAALLGIAASDAQDGDRTADLRQAMIGGRARNVLLFIDLRRALELASPGEFTVM